MRRFLPLVLLCILCLSGCGSGAQDTPCYEEFPQVPDLGALLGLSPSAVTEEDGVRFYYYLNDGSIDFEGAAEAYAAACGGLGYAGSGGEGFYAAQCGDKGVFLAPLTLEDETGSESFFVLMIGAEED